MGTRKKTNKKKARRNARTKKPAQRTSLPHRPLKKPPVKATRVRKRKSAPRSRSRRATETETPRPRWLGYADDPTMTARLEGLPDPLPPIADCIDDEIMIRRKDVPFEEAEKRKSRFLDAMSICGLVLPSCWCAGINRKLADNWRKNDAAFAEEWDRAYADSVDRLELSARARAVDGTDKPVVYQGEITETYKEYSDTLMLALLKGHNRERFTERTRTEHSGHILNPSSMDQESKEDVIRSILGMIQPKKDPVQ